MKNTTKRLFYFILPLLLFGCGPGFPIMTAGQEAMVNDVNRLKKESRLDGDRLSSTESELTELNQEIEEVDFRARKSTADLNVAMDRVGADWAALRGEIEEVSHESTLLREDISNKGMSLGEMKAELNIVTALQDEIASLNSRFDEIVDRVNAIEKTAKKPPAEKTAVSKKDPAKIYKDIFKLMEQKDYDNALKGFREFIKNYPKHKYADNSQYWIGEVFYARHDWEKAILEFDDVIKKYPKGDKVPDAFLKQALSFYNMDAKKESTILFKKIIKDFPKSDEAKVAQKKLKELK